MLPISLKYIVVLALLTLALSACGVVFRSDFEGTEVFKGLSVESDFEPGSPITVVLEVDRSYPVPLWLSCRYENTDVTDDERAVAFNERTQEVFETVLDPAPGGDPGDEDAPSETYEFSFTIVEPGDYFIACFTVAAPENGIGQGFTISSGR